MCRLLFVDKDPHILLLYRTEFENEGYDVDISAAPSVALELLQRVDYSAVVMDVRMPGGEGFSLLAAIRENHGSLPVVINSTSSCSSDVPGVAAWIIKSPDLGELKSAVRDAVRNNPPVGHGGGPRGPRLHDCTYP